MIYFKSSDKDLIFIDKVLNYLNNNISKNSKFINIINDLDVTKVKIEFEDKPPLIFDYVNEKSWEENYYLASCLMYLIQNGYVISPTKDEFRITYKGILKLKITTFSEEGFQSNWGKPKDFYLFLIAFISLVIALIKIAC